METSEPSVNLSVEEAPPPSCFKARGPPWFRFLQEQIFRVISPLKQDLELETIFLRGSVQEGVILVFTLLGFLGLLSFSLWFWFQVPTSPGIFWQQIAELTNWGLLLTIVLLGLTAFIGMKQRVSRRYTVVGVALWEKSLRCVGVWH